MYQIVAGLASLHENRVMHRDIKPQNVLIGEGHEVKLADFGLAKLFSLSDCLNTKEVVTLWYRAPELLCGLQNYSQAIDVWSAGCIFGELVTGRPLFAGDSEIDVVFKIFRSIGTPTDNDWPRLRSDKGLNKPIPHYPKRLLQESIDLQDLSSEGADLLSQMLFCDPQKRISAKSALAHSFFAEEKTPRNESLFR